MPDNILFLGNDSDCLQMLNDLAADADIVVHAAHDYDETFRLLVNKEIAVMFSENRFTRSGSPEEVKALMGVSPETTRIMVTCADYIPSPLEVVSFGKVFRMVAKPGDACTFKKLVREGLEDYFLAKSLSNGRESALLSIAQRIEIKDPLTRGHCERVASYALMIAEGLRLDENLKQLIKHGGWLHDCGKIGVAESILNYPGKLSDNDFNIVKEHPLWGARLARQARLPQTVINTILYHHECYDGAGYPQNLRGKNIPVEARIVSIADTFDALTSDRPYRTPVPWDEAIEWMNSLSSIDLDPELMEIFRSACIRNFGKTAD